MRRFRPIVAAAVSVLLSDCSAADQAAQVRAARDQDQRATLGQVQAALRVGMTSADVVQALGAPNMVTTDENRREVWVYDKVATEHVASSGAGGIGIPLIAGAFSGASASSTSQRTQTVIVKFDDQQRVRDFAYRASSF
jgi:outer membrane protein assembly factor BamE (lipoprotein component of BamABCDE complex)